MRLGYALSSEEHAPHDLVRHAVAAEEAVDVMRKLWERGLVSHRGRHYTVDRARLYSVPDEPPAVAVAAAGPNAAALAGRIGSGQELALPRHFQQAAKTLTAEQVAEAVVCGPDPERHREAIAGFEEAGFDHVYIHQVGPDQEGFMRFYEREVLGATATRA